MAHGERAANRGNKEYWSRRPCKLKFRDAGKTTKKLTHRAERRKPINNGE